MLSVPFDFAVDTDQNRPSGLPRLANSSALTDTFVQ
jgi:hypothetical protein